MTLNALLQRFTALIICFCLAASSTSIAWAQGDSRTDSQAGSQAGLSSSINLGSVSFGDDSDIRLFLAQADVGPDTGTDIGTNTDANTLDFDITAPSISHSPPISKGVAGEVQTVVAEISDNQSVARALLIHRNNTADFYSTTEMSADVTNTTWLATVDTTTEDSQIYYYIVAEDTDGNRVQKGSESNPLTLSLQQTEILSAAAPIRQDNRNRWLAIGAGVLAVGALLLLSGGSNDGGGGIMNSDDTTCCTITFTVPNVSTQ